MASDESNADMPGIEAIPTETSTADTEARPPNLLAPGVAPWPLDGGPLIELRDVHKAFDGDPVLKGVDLDIQPGQITVIMGASASGKTVLVKHINGLMVPDSGTIRVFGEDITEMGDRELDRKVRRRVATLFQSYALFDSMSVVENVAFPLVQNDAMAAADAEARAAEILEELGLGHVLDEYPAALSGGMKKRVALARTIITNPEVVLFDDPTTGLDPVMTQLVDEMIADITRRFRLTSVIVSHNLASIFRLADRVAVLHDGRIIAEGTPAETKASEDPRLRQFVDRLERLQIDEEESTTDRGEGDSPASGEELVVEVRAIHKSFGDRAVLKGASLRVPRHEITVVIGGSGSGKSVMMKHILGLLTADRGSVHLFGRNVADMAEKELREARGRIGMLFQHSALFDSMNVRDNVAFPLVESRGVKRREAMEKVERVLEQLRVAEIADQMPSEISNGQQKRVSLARAIIVEPDLMVYDEPTTGQDPIMSDYVETMILEAQKAFELTSIIISHDMASTFRVADSIALLHQGEIILQGTPKAFLESEDPRVREFVFASALDDDDDAPEER